MVIDEIYTYIGKKSTRHYIWTALILHEGKKYPAFHISKSKNINDLDDFVRYLPEVKLVYSDGNPTYKEFYEKRNIAEKGVMTNLIESTNAQLRHYCSNLIRKGKTYAKSIDSFKLNLHMIFAKKLIPSI
jgi:IS1 family transposase